ncbi:E3 ubiquitin-protein ligase SH3RF1-like isoform X1 [Mytilus californianus]|uniref:E3 ubiquitin-protein ligase SH3RF1-like isoform X1 n=1 Tax=Mytilus californianus TaxID=6549 RepID=UPI00224867C1|nr:E3 ubiquitin-protein ligase SH3RF1-like isoform X1 [Mytilus californianus]
MDEQSLNELLECSVCLDRLDHTSKVLPCQHTFCRRCLEEIVSTKGELRCPECRYLVEIRVEELPSNILLIRLLEGIKTKTCTERSRSPGRYTNDELSSGSATDRHSKQSVGKLPCAKALYNYEGKDSNDLSFRKGDIIILKKQVDDNWYHGEFNSHHGFFPASYVQVLVQLTSNVPQCKTLYDFEMKDESDKKDCLFFKKDETITVLKKVDDNWLEGRKGEKIGIFPVSFVEMNDAARSLINSQSNPSLHGGNLILHDRGSGDGVPHSSPLSSLVTQIPQQKRHSFTASPQKTSTAASQHNRRSLELSSSGNLVIVPSPHLPSRSRSPPPVPSHNSQSATSANKTTSVLASKSSVASRNSSLTASKTSSATGSKLNSAFQEPGTSRKFDNSMEPQTGPAIVDASKISGINSPVYTALFNYKPHREDEIELRKGDYYTVCDKCQDGWYRGQCLKTGKPGVFPGNYVQMVRLPSAFLPVSGNVMNIHSKGIHSLPSSSSAPAVTMTTSSGHRSSTSPIRPGSSPSLQNSSSQQAESSSGPPPITPRSSKSLAKLSSSAPSRSAANSKTSSHSSASNKSSATKLTNSGPSSPRSASSRTSSSSSLKPADSSGTKAKSPHRHANHNGPSVGMEGHLDLSVTSGHSNHRTSSSKQVVYRKPNAVGMPQVMSASSNITPPNIVAGATGEIPGIKDNKKDKKEKEKLSLVKRLTSGKSKKSKSPGLESDGSGTESIGNHVRSGSCPADSNSLLGAEGSQHMKTGSFDSTVPLVPQQKISRPKPVVREKYRCVVPYPPQSDVELELKVGDVVYVHKKREDGWYKGTLQRLGKTGLFPGSFVEKCENV